MQIGLVLGVSSMLNSSSLYRGRSGNPFGNTFGNFLTIGIFWTSIGSTPLFMMYDKYFWHPLSNHLLALKVEIKLVGTPLSSLWDTNSVPSLGLARIHLSLQSIKAQFFFQTTSPFLKWYQSQILSIQSNLLTVLSPQSLPHIRDTLISPLYSPPMGSQ